MTDDAFLAVERSHGMRLFIFFPHFHYTFASRFAFHADHLFQRKNYDVSSDAECADRTPCDTHGRHVYWSVSAFAYSERNCAFIVLSLMCERRTNDEKYAF